jgi:hypothetical protein
MKIGIFGDSYADGNPQTYNSSGWPHMLKDNYKDVTFHGLAGTSVWWSRNLFLEHYKNYDVIIFSFTSNNRWPYLPKHLDGSQWNIGYVEESKSDFLNVVNPYFWELFPDDLNDYINTSIYKDIVKLCKENNKYLIAVIPFDHNYDIHTTDFPCITGLDNLSHREQLEIDGQLIGTIKMFSKTEGFIDIRTCHLSPDNNRIISDWMTDCIDTKKYGEYFDGDKFPDWKLIANKEHAMNLINYNPQ